MVKRTAPESYSNGREHTKRAKRYHASVGTFANIDDIRFALSSPDASVLAHALATLRNQLTIRPNEPLLATQDERLLLAKSWADASPGVEEVFSIMYKSPQPHTGVTSLCLAVLSSLLDLFSTHLVYHAFGDPIMKSLLSASNIQQLNTNLASANSELILSTLKIFNAMSTYGRCSYQKFVMEAFSWGQKSLHKLLFLRRKNKRAQEVDPISKPDIRTLYIFFILSFLSNVTPTSIKLLLLGQHQDVFLLIFKGIAQDPYPVIRRILGVCWEGVWNDSKIKRTLKIGLFNEETISHLLKLYARDSPEDSSKDHIPADLVHHFMLVLATRPGIGICFKDCGWYPRDDSLEEGALKHPNGDDDDVSAARGGKINNKILANIIKGLKINDDARQQELAIKILEACPELVKGYWNAVNLTLEPRLSSRWINNIAFLGTIISLPIPKYSFLLPRSTQHNPSAPPISSTLANVLPLVFTKSHFTKGLQSPSRLVQHCTALALIKCLTKLHGVLVKFREVARQLEEDEAGQWSKRWHELEAEAEKKVPDFMVIIAMVQQKMQDNSNEQDDMKTTLLTESALRLLWLYHRLFPRLIAEVRFDVGKLVLSDTYQSSRSLLESCELEGPKRINILRQLHALRLLQENDQFVWSNKFGPSSRSYLSIILNIYTKTSHLVIRTATSALLSHMLSSSLLFSHDPTELVLWLGALPTTHRASHATAPDGTILSDESTGVLIFLDDCIQRCVKTPYRYLEDTISFFSNTTSEESYREDSLFADDQKNAPSPLLVVLLEQLGAKLNGKLISPSDTLAIVTFIRRLTSNLACKLPTLYCAQKLQTKLREICLSESVIPTAPTIRDALEGECEMLSGTLGFIEVPNVQVPAASGPTVQKFVTQVEKLPAPPTANAASEAAYELVDWMRLIRPALHPSDVKRLMLTILKFFPPAAKEFLYQLDARHGQLWYAIQDNFEGLQSQLPFEWAYLHATPAQISQPYVKDRLAILFFSEAAWSKSLSHRLSFVMLRLASRIKKSEPTRHPELSLITSILAHSRSTRNDTEQLKRIIFAESRPIRELCCSPDVSTAELEDLRVLIRTCLEPQSPSDKALALEYCNFWLAYSSGMRNLRSCALASPWLRYMDPTDVVQYLDIVTSAIRCGYRLSCADKDIVICILDSILMLLQASAPLLTASIQGRSHDLLVLRSCLDSRSILDAILLFIVESGLPLGYNGLPLATTPSITVSDVSLVAQKRWKSHSDCLSSFSHLTTEFLQSENWTETSARIVSGTLYLSSSARQKFFVWLTQKQPHEGSSLEPITIALHAFLDIPFQDDAEMHLQLPDPWFLALVRHLLLNQSTRSTLAVCASCIYTAVQASPSRRAHYANQILDEARVLSAGIINSPFLILIRDLQNIDMVVFSDLFSECSEEALKWMAGRFSGTSLSEDDLLLVDDMISMMSRKEARSYLVEPVLKAAIQNCLHVPRLIQTLIPVLSSTSFKPATVNRLLQSIVQHFQLFRLTDASLETREPIIRLLHTLFYLHPANTCQPSHIAPLSRLYGGTLSSSDRHLLSVFYLYENQRKESLASIFRQWSLSGSPSIETVGAITNLEPSRVFRTCTAFPTRRCLNATLVEDNVFTEDRGSYDPIFLTLLLVQFLAERKDISTTDWVQIFRSNIVSVVICVLTSRDEALRKVGISTLAGVLRRIQTADFFERDQVIYVMDMLRDLLHSPSPSSVTSTPRLPTHAVMFLAHGLRSIFYPASFLYPLISRFLLQRPEFDTTDVPMLYSLLYSSADGGTWTRERTWIIRFLTDSIREGGGRDWAALRRRHTWDLLASMWQGTREDERALRRGILEFLANLSTNPHAITSLVLRSSLPSWIEMQLHIRAANEFECIAFAKILENVLVMVDIHKVNKATCGEFSAAVTRCLNAILHKAKLSALEETTILVLLYLISRALLRMALHPPYPCASMLGEALKHTLSILQDVESSISWKTIAYRHSPRRLSVLHHPPHHSLELFDMSTAKDSIEVWSECVRLLWRTSMSLEEWPGNTECWDALSYRLLAVRASGIYFPGGPGEEDLGEWARRQTINCLLMSEVKNSTR